MINRRPNDPSTIDVTVVLPAHNEEGNVAPLMDQFGELSRKARFSIEVILVDDGSTDQTLPRAVEAQERHRFLRIVSLPHRRGLTEALRAGFSVARGQIIVFYPADRQFHPADIPRMVEKVRSGYDLVTGRKIGYYNKKFVSSFYNRLSRWLFPSIKVSDLNSVKAFRRELIDVLDYRHDWHRFWVAIVAEAGYRIGEVDVTLYQRGSGRSKFGFWRIPGGVLDLIAVKFQYHTMKRPLWYFGMTGLLLLAAGFVVGLAALYQRFVEGHGYRPLVYLVMTLGLGGVLFFAIGFLAEAVAGLRQQLDTLKPGPRPHVYKPGGPESNRRVPESRSERGPDRPVERGSDRRREGDRSEQFRRDRGPRREENRRRESSPAQVPNSPEPAQPSANPVAAEELLPHHDSVEIPEVSSGAVPEVESAAATQHEPSAEIVRDEVADTSNPSTASSPPEKRPTSMYGRRKRA